jgi:hypothetical protein
LSGVGNIILSEKTNILLGDINKDGKVNAGDYTLLRRHLLRIDGYILEGDKLKAADVDLSGAVNAGDFTLIRKFILKIISVFPVNNQ